MNFLTTTTESYISLFFTLAVLLWKLAIRSLPSAALSAAWLPSRTTRSFWRLALTV